jgi:hypothetical protein
LFASDWSLINGGLYITDCFRDELFISDWSLNSEILIISVWTLISDGLLISEWSR